MNALGFSLASIAHPTTDTSQDPDNSPYRDSVQYVAYEPLRSVGNVALLDKDCIVSEPIHLIKPSLQMRLFHELGGSMDWFERVVIPHIKYWSAHVHRLVMIPPYDDELSLPGTNLRCLVIEHLIDEGLRMVGFSHGLSHHSQYNAPASRLMKLHQAVIDTIWCVLQGIEIKSESGAIWRLGEGVLRVWLDQNDSAGGRFSVVGHFHQDIWNQAIQELIRKKIWSLTPTGRWLSAQPHPLLLWPLAAKDLQHQLLSYGSPKLSIEAVRCALKKWGYTNPHALSGELFSWIREDGKSFFGLQATPRLIALMQGKKSTDLNLPFRDIGDRKPVCVA